jgi:hypothetical protein
MSNKKLIQNVNFLLLQLTVFCELNFFWTPQGNQLQYFTQFGHMAKLGESTFFKQKRINCQGK